MGSSHQLSPFLAVSAGCFQDKHVSLWAATASVMKEENLLPGPREVSMSVQGTKEGFVLLLIFIVYSTNLLIIAIIY